MNTSQPLEELRKLLAAKEWKKGVYPNDYLLIISALDALGGEVGQDQ